MKSTLFLRVVLGFCISKIFLLLRCHIMSSSCLRFVDPRKKVQPRFIFQPQKKKEKVDTQIFLLTLP